VLVGLLVRDFHTLTSGLSNYFQSYQVARERADWIAFSTAVTLIILFVRNIHGSARYDDYIGERKYLFSLDETVWKRFGAFFLTFLALFGGPISASHILSYHLDNGASTFWLLLLLFFTLLIYAFWNFCLWVSEARRVSTLDSPTMQDITHQWVKVDALAILFGAVLGLSVFALQIKKQKLAPDLIALGFVGIALFVIITDYYLNRYFYFPAIKREAESPGYVTDQELSQRLEEQTVLIRSSVVLQITNLRDKLSCQISQASLDTRKQTDAILSEMTSGFERQSKQLDVHEAQFNEYFSDSDPRVRFIVLLLKKLRNLFSGNSSPR
jgi:hypothetical protein